MLRRLFLPILFLSFTAFAQEPSPCALAVPDAVSANRDPAAQATCPCRVTSFEVKVFSRWAQEVWSTNKLEGFPNDLLAAKDLPSGTYFWQVKYTAILNGEPVELETNGYLTVIK